MNFSKLQTLIAGILLFFSASLYGQKHITNPSNIGLEKNIIHGSLGYIIAYSAATANYERMIFEPKDGFINSYWARIGYGGFLDFYEEGPLYLIALTALTGSGNKHMEFNLGFTSRHESIWYKTTVNNAQIAGDPVPKKSEFRNKAPVIGVGYRFQKPGGKFMFRTGLGYPESVYLGFGFCF